jgi:hypothetical protein
VPAYLEARRVTIHTIIIVEYKPSITNTQLLVYSFATGNPLSVLGAAVSVMSLIIQIADECVKGLDVFESVETQLMYCRL